MSRPDDKTLQELLAALHEISNVSTSPAGAHWQSAATHAMTLAKRAVGAFQRRKKLKTASVYEIEFAHGAEVFWPQPPSAKPGHDRARWTVGSGEVHAFTITRKAVVFVHIVTDFGIVQVPIDECEPDRFLASKAVNLRNDGMRPVITQLSDTLNPITEG